MRFLKKVFNNGASPAINATNLNLNENGIFDAYYQSGATPFEAAVLTPTYLNGNLISEDERIAGLLYRRIEYTYTNGNLTTLVTKIYAANGVTIIKQATDTISYLNGNYNGESRVVNI